MFCLFFVAIYYYLVEKERGGDEKKERDYELILFLYKRETLPTFFF